MNVQRGEVVLVDYPYAVGREAKGRSVLVVQMSRSSWWPN